VSYYDKNKFVGTNIEFKAFLQGRESIRAEIVTKLNEAVTDQDGWAVVNLKQLIEYLGETFEQQDTI
jgi:hypothetical protein